MESGNILDNILSALRARKIKKYIFSNSIVCDVGCGNGKLLKGVASHIDKGIGIDKDIKSVNFDNLEFYTLDLNKDPIPLENNSVDIVLMLAVIEHLDKPENIIKEIHRILKTGGTLLLTTPTPKAKPILEFLAFNLGVISKSSIADHKRYFSAEKLKALLTTTDFKNSLFFVKTFQLGLNLFCIAKKD